MTRRAARRVLAVRLDNEGDVLLTGPAVRAIAASGARVSLWCGRQGEQAAALLPGVVDQLAWSAPWIGFAPEPADPAEVERFVAEVRRRRFDEAVIFTSFHQSALPAALLLQLAGIGTISAISDDHPGALLSLRHRVTDELHEVERNLSLAAAAGYPLPPDDDGGLALRRPLPDVSALVDPATELDRYVVVHPGVSVPARAWSPIKCATAVQLLAEAGWRVLVTGAAPEQGLTRFVAGRHGVDLGGRTTLAELAAVLEGADAVVVGNTGPAHLAAAVGTPVVSLFAPVVPARRWAPYGVPHILLGDQAAVCRDSRARECSVPGHPCLNDVPPEAAVNAVSELVGVLA